MYIHTYIRTYVCTYIRIYIYTYVCINTKLLTVGHCPHKLTCPDKEFSYDILVVEI